MVSGLHKTQTGCLQHCSQPDRAQGSGEDFGRRALPSPAMATSSHRARRLAGVVRMGGCFCAGCCGAAVLFALVGRLDLGFTSGRSAVSRYNP